MTYLTQMLLVLFFGVLFHIAMFLAVRYIKNKKQFLNGLWIIVPNVTLNAAVLFFMFYSSSTSYLPEKIDFNNQNAEQKIERLEDYTRKLDTYLKSSNRDFFMLIGALFVLYTIPLITVTIALTESTKSENIGR